MNILKKINNNPNQFLYYELLMGIWYIFSGFIYWRLLEFSTLEFVCTASMVIMIGVMGFVFPQKAFHIKIYWIAQLCILFLPYISNNFIYLPLLSTIVFLRAYQIYGIKSVRYLSILVILFIFISSRLVRSGMTQAVNSSDISYIHSYIRVNYVFWLIVAILLIVYMIATSESKKKLNIALKQVQEYSIKIEEQAIQIERNRIKRDMHDSLGYNLTAINFQLENGLNLIEQSQYEQANETFIASQELVQECLDNMRSIISDFSNKSLVESSFEKEIIKLIKDFKKTTTIYTQFSISIKNYLSPEIINTIYRITQECLTNILRHSGATKVGIVIFTRDNVLNFIVKDDGRGFESNNPIIGFGLVGIKERVHNLNGKCEIITKPEDGCQISIEIPLQQNP